MTLKSRGYNITNVYIYKMNVQKNIYKEEYIYKKVYIKEYKHGKIYK